VEDAPAGVSPSAALRRDQNLDSGTEHRESLRQRAFAILRSSDAGAEHTARAGENARRGGGEAAPAGAREAGDEPWPAGSSRRQGEETHARETDVQYGTSSGVGAGSKNREHEGVLQLGEEAGAGAIRDDVSVRAKGDEQGVRVQVDREAEVDDAGGCGGCEEGDSDHAPLGRAPERDSDRWGLRGRRCGARGDGALRWGGAL